MAADGESGRLFAADCDFVFIDQFADVLEAYRSFIEQNLMVIGEGVYEVGGGDGFGNPVAPAARLDQIIEEQGDDVIGLDKDAVGVDDAEAVGVAVRSDDEACADLVHFGFRVPEKVVVGFWRMAAKEHIAIVVDRFDSDSRLTQNMATIATTRAPEGIEDDLDARCGNGFEIDE